MSRPLRIQFPQAVYHVMNRGRSRQPVFIDDADYQAFFDTLADGYRLWSIEVFAYALMGNHYHLCLRTPKGNLSRVMRHVDGLYTQRFNRHHRRDGTLFRGRYRAILVDADEYLAAVVRYIHLNPVEAGLAKMPEDYLWASHRYYVQAKGSPGWLDTAQALEQIGGRQAFHEFVLSGNEESLKQFYKAKRQSPILGNEAYVERIREMRVPPAPGASTLRAARRRCGTGAWDQRSDASVQSRPGGDISRDEGTRERGAESYAVFGEAVSRSDATRGGGTFRDR